MPYSHRSITSTDAKSNLGELLASLNSAGPIEITRNGKAVGLLSPVLGQTPDAGRLSKFAAAYSNGAISWSQIAEETGVSYGELLMAMALQSLPLPQVIAKKSPAQFALFGKILKVAAARSKAAE